jgi:hypothetical protein
MCLEVGFTHLAPSLPQVIAVLGFVGDESASFTAGRVQNVLADKGGRLDSVFAALAGFTHASVMGQTCALCKRAVPPLPEPLQLHMGAERRDAPS